MNNLALIPARGGSKRIPRKNIKDFLGKPIIAYSIELAFKSGFFQEVMVSTDDKKIAEVSKEYGAEVPFMRSKEAANEFATLSDVVEEVKEEYKARGKEFDNICCILATAPLMSVKFLSEGYKILLDKKADSVRPVVKFSYPIQRALRMNNGKVEMFNEQYRKTRSQDLESAYHDAGQFYWMNFEGGLKGENKFGFEIPAISVQDIDTLEDWKLAELKYRGVVDE